MVKGCFFFAQNAVAEQFGFRGERVLRFDPETGECEDLGASLEEWAGKILADPDYLLLTNCIYEWAAANADDASLAPNERIVPKVPFVTGGEYTASNLYKCDAAISLGFRATIARQIRDLPDGSRIKFEFRKKS